MLPHQPVQTVSFAAEKDCGRQFPVPVGVRLFRVTGGSDHPDVTFFQLLYQSNQISHACHWNILERAGGNLRHHARQADRSSLRDEDSVNAGTLRSAQDRSHVSWIFDAVETEDYWRI